MSIPMLFNRWNVWRLTNSVIIFFSFFVPWFRYDIGRQPTGFEFLDYVQYMARELFVQEIEFFGLFGQLIVYLYAILIYCVLNLLLLFLRRPLAKRSDQMISSLRLILITLGAIGFWKISFSFIGGGWGILSNVFWGYKFILIGIISAFILEISYFISKRI